jgi:hypothetical protein
MRHGRQAGHTGGDEDRRPAAKSGPGEHERDRRDHERGRRDLRDGHVHAWRERDEIERRSEIGPSGCRRAQYGLGHVELGAGAACDVPRDTSRDERVFLREVRDERERRREEHEGKDDRQTPGPGGMARARHRAGSAASATANVARTRASPATIKEGISSAAG